MVRITEYWNTVVDDPTCIPYGRRVTGEYEVKSRFTVNATLESVKETAKKYKNPKMTIFPDKVIEDLGLYYGIHSYREIIEI